MNKPKIVLTKAFDKDFQKLPTKKQLKVLETIEIFDNNPRTRSLRLHQLEGKLAGVWSISAGGDLRLHFRYRDDTVVFFLAVGSHARLY